MEIRKKIKLSTQCLSLFGRGIRGLDKEYYFKLEDICQ